MYGERTTLFGSGRIWGGSSRSGRARPLQTAQREPDPKVEEVLKTSAVWTEKVLRFLTSSSSRSYSGSSPEEEKSAAHRSPLRGVVEEQSNPRAGD